MLALLAIGFAEDMKKDKRSVNDFHVEYQPSTEEQGVLDNAILTHIAQSFSGAQVIEQPSIGATAETPIVSEAASIEARRETQTQALQIAQEALPLVQQAIQAVVPTEQQVIQSVQFAPQNLQYTTQPIQYSQEPIQSAPQTVLYAPDVISVHNVPPVPTVERTIYKTTHIDHLVPQVSRHLLLNYLWPFF